MSSSTRARWETVYDDLRRRIEDGIPDPDRKSQTVLAHDEEVLAPGAQVPSEFSLAETHGVSRNTVRVALTRLEQDGLITEGKGRLGRTVRESDPLVWRLHVFEGADRGDDPDRGLDAWAQGVIEQGRSPSQLVTVGIELPPRHVARRLGVELGTMAARRTRMRCVDGVPYQLSTSWFPEDIARDSPLMHEGDVTMPGGILASIGHPQRRREDEITVRMPTPEERRELDIPVGTPVIQHVRLGHGDSRPVRCMVTIAPGDRHILRYELEP